MSGFRPMGYCGELERRLMPGDLLIAGESLTQGIITTAGAGTWTGAAIASGIITRSGPSAGYTDTTDTANNIIAALAGASPAADLSPGSTFRLKFIQLVAYAMTLAAGRGIILGTKGTNVLNTTGATQVKEYLFTVLNNTLEVVLNCNTTNSSTAVTFVLPPNMTALPMGQADNPQGITITPGMTVTGTGISAGTTVAGLTQGPGGVTGVTLSANATATSSAGGVNLTFSPTIEIDSLGSSSLL